NRTRLDFLQEFQKMIDEYNSGAANIETFFAKLTAFAQKLTEEEKRGISEQLSEEELVIFDLLTKLEKLKSEKLVLDWKKRQTTRAAVRFTIETVLDELPRVYTPELYNQKCDRIYQHVFDSYQGQGKSLYVN